MNLDLIYGLPKQSVASFETTLERVLDIAPERIALYNYAHLPTVFMPQRRIQADELPAPDAKLQILTRAIETLNQWAGRPLPVSASAWHDGVLTLRLTRAGYVYIGMDHFARPDDELAVAQRHGRLQRNFQGYSTHAESDLLGFGVSAIGRVGPTYYQNVKTLDEYYRRLDEDQLPVWRGLELTQDDLLRRAVIQALACHFRLSIESIEDAYLIDFRETFAAELADLEGLRDAGLVELQPDWIVVTARGRLLVRAVCMVFDHYLRTRLERARYSKVI